MIIAVSLIGVVVFTALMIFYIIITRKYVFLSDRQLRQQMLMADISRSFLSGTEMDTLITDTLRMIGEFMEISQLLLFMLEEDGFTLTCREEYMDPRLNLETRIGSHLPLQEPMYSIMKSLVPGVGKDSCMHSNDPVTRKAMAPYRVMFQNYITTPIFVKGELIGVIDFSKGSQTQSWSDSEISLATLFSSTLSGVYEREEMGLQTSIVENSPHMIFYADSAGNLIYANPAATVVTGYSLAELKAGGFALILSEEAVRYVKEVYIPHTVKKDVMKHEAVMICKDGRKRNLDVTSFSMKDGMTAAICIDMTDMRAMETELRNAKIKADQASRAKSDFLSNMSHEMRTPMNAIIGMTAIAKNASDNERKNYALGKVEEASTHLLGIINDILDMMKIEANKLELLHLDFDLRNVLQKAVSFVNFRMEEKKQRFSMNVAGNIPFFLVGDDQRLTQVITNLLANAVKFTPEEGEIGLDVSLSGEAAGISELRFSVADSGIGLTPEQQKKIFRMFEQGDRATTRKYGGTGLGLAISNRIVELMGGRFTVESEIGKGSRFIFNILLPRVTEDPSEQPGAGRGTPAVITAKDIKAGCAGRKLLVAEDIEINLEILLSLLEDTGLVIDTAENGREVVEKFSADPGSYDLILMDMQMPEMDGLEATRLIRQFEAEHSREGIPIIAMTANVFKDDIDNCLAAGMNDHMGKPIDINLLFAKLLKFLQQ